MTWCLTDFGACPGSGEFCTQALQAAVDSAFAAGGGRVIIPRGTFLTGSIEWKSGVEIHLDAGARLLGSPHLKDYPALPPPFKVPLRDNYSWRALFYSYGAQKIALTGKGIIDGGGSAADFRVHDPIFWNKVENRPHGIYLRECQDIRIEGVTLRNSAFWMVRLSDCSRVILRDLTIENLCNHNNDGVDFDKCSEVIVSGCRMACSDDALCFKSMTPGRCERITVTNCILLSHYNSLKVGTETAGGLSGLTVSHCLMGGIPSEPHRLEPGGRTRGFAGLALISADGAIIEDVVISHCVIRHVKAPFFLRLQNRGVRYWPGAPEKPVPGALRRVSIEGICVSDTTQLASSVTGLPEAPLEDIAMRGITLTLPGGLEPWPMSASVPEKPADYPDCNMFGEELPATALYARHVRKLALRDWLVREEKPSRRPAFVWEDVTIAEPSP